MHLESFSYTLYWNKMNVLKAEIFMVNITESFVISSRENFWSQWQNKLFQRDLQSNPESEVESDPDEKGMGKSQVKAKRRMDNDTKL